MPALLVFIPWLFLNYAQCSKSPIISGIMPTYSPHAYRSGVYLCLHPDQGEGSFSKLATFPESLIRGAWVHAWCWRWQWSYKSSLHAFLTFVHKGKLNDNPGSIVHDAEIVWSRDELFHSCIHAVVCSTFNSSAVSPTRGTLLGFSCGGESAETSVLAWSFSVLYLKECSCVCTRGQCLPLNLGGGLRRHKHCEHVALKTKTGEALPTLVWNF